MYEDEYEGNSGELLVRLLNLSRFFIYSAAVWVQTIVLVECFSGSPPQCNAMIVIVPLLLGIWDFLMAVSNIKPLTPLWIIAFLAPLVSIGVAINTIAPILIMQTIPQVESIMLGLSLLVLLISILELHTLRRVGRFWIRKTTNRNTSAHIVDEIRTYDT